MIGKCDKCETCIYQADLISPAEEAICPDCTNGSEYAESYVSKLKREKSELENKLEIMKCCGNCQHIKTKWHCWDDECKRNTYFTKSLSTDNWQLKGESE